MDKQNLEKVVLVVRGVAERTGTTEEDIRGLCRKEEFATPRNCLMYVVKNNLGWSDKDIGKFFGERHRTTAYSGITVCEGLLEIRDKKMLGIKSVIDEVWAGIFTEG